MGGRIAEGHQGVGRPCCCIEEGALGKSGRVTQGCGTRSQVDRSDWKWFQEKPLSFSCTRPYRKPTQVDGMNIPRRLRELRRSEEHTSELQSLMRISYAVFCLKKKNKN